MSIKQNYDLSKAGPQSEFGRALQDATVGMIDPLMLRIDSSNSEETHNWLGPVPGPVKRSSTRTQATVLGESKLTIVNDEYEAAFRVSEAEYERGTVAQSIAVRARELAMKCALHPLSQVSRMMVAGTGTTLGTAYDGAAFFAARTDGRAGSQTNLLTNTQVPALNVGTAAEPTQAEFANALLGVIGYMQSYLDSWGDPMQEFANQFAVMVPLNLVGAAYAAVGANTIVGTAGAVSNNPIMGVLTGAGRPLSITVHPNPRITATTVFYVYVANYLTRRPFIWQTEVWPPRLEILGAGSEYAIENGEHLYKAKFRAGYGYGEWRNAAHCTLS